MNASRLAVVVVLLTGLITGCATPYQRVGATGGYSETRLDEHVARVNFSGNGYTGAERASDFCLLRCAEVTLEHGCHFITILQGGDSVAYSTYTTPTTSYTTGGVSVYGNTAYGSATTNSYGGQTYLISKLSTTLLIACSLERPDGQVAVLDAEFICSSIRAKYGLTVPGQGSTEGEANEQPEQDELPMAAANEHPDGTR